MIRFAVIVILSFVVFGCAFVQDVVETPVEEVVINEIHIDKSDSLNTVIERKNTILDSLNLVLEEMEFTVDSLRSALDISNSRVAVNTEFQIPDSVFFAGRKFDLTNQRLYEKFVKIYKMELKSAHKFIPRGGKYFALFDSVFSEKGIPTDTKYLAVAESRLSPMATSRVGAAGIWQFMKSTGKGYGLKVDSFVDERRHVLKSTLAAAKYLLDAKYHLAKYGTDDWLLILSSYNAGVGSVSKVIKQQGGRDFFDLIMKADETHNFVWRAVAIKFIFENQEAIFGKKFEPEQPLFKIARQEKLLLKGHYKIDNWANAQGTTVGEIWELNPWIKIYQRSRSKYSPINDVVLPPGSYNVCVPKYGKKEEAELKGIRNRFLIKNAGYFTHHTVRKGDTLYDIARKYKTKVSNIKSLNGLKNNTIRPGQKLRLYGSPSGSNSGTYVVKKGDSVGGIAQKLGIKQKIIIKKNNLKTKNGIVLIYPGQKLFY